MKTKIINIEPYNVDVEIKDDKFILIFDGETPGRPQSEKKVKIHLEHWWITDIAEKLWQVIERQQNEIDIYKKTMKGE